VVTVAPELLAQYAGTYSVSPFEAKAIVTVEDNQLMIARSEGWNGVLKRPLLAESPSAFYFGVTNGDFEFVRDDRGVVTHFIRYNGDGGAKWMRD
jgi:hypothetical protein